MRFGPFSPGSLRARYDDVVAAEFGEHQDDSRHRMHRGRAVYLPPDGPFTYGDFTVESIQYDVAGPLPD